VRRHKNISVLLRAFREIRKGIAGLGLVIVGRPGNFGEIKPGGGVIHLKSLDDDYELAGIYNLSSVFCSLSLYEGFGLTVLEAQRCGVPVVCSDIPAHLEVGGAGIMPVCAYDVDRVVQALYNVSENAKIRSGLIAAGFDNVSRFSWDLAAAETVKVYESLFRR